MKTRILLLVTMLSATLWAQPLPPTIPGAPGFVARSTNQLNLDAVPITNQLGQVYSPEDIEYQLADLHRAIEQATPVLRAVTETYSNSVASTQPSPLGGIAEILGGVLNRNTNDVASRPSNGNTNDLGRILRDALSAVATNAASTNVSELQDLIALQAHLQAATPILQRLGISTNLSTGTGGPQNESVIGTGAGRGGKKPDQNPRVPPPMPKK